MNCKECDKPATIGSYCIAHHLERTNAIITAQFAIQSAESAEARAEQYKSDAMRFETERDAAIDSAEYYKHTHLSMQTTIDELSAQLATAQAQRDEAQEHLVYLFDHLKVWLGARLIGDVEP